MRLAGLRTLFASQLMSSGPGQPAPGGRPPYPPFTRDTALEKVRHRAGTAMHWNEGPLLAPFHKRARVEPTCTHAPPASPMHPNQPHQVRLAEAAWNTRNPDVIALACECVSPRPGGGRCFRPERRWVSRVCMGGLGVHVVGHTSVSQTRRTPSGATATRSSRAATPSRYIRQVDAVVMLTRPC
jgi:hypothetical protein